MLATETLDDLAEVDGWAVDGSMATFRPLPAGWMARVHYRTVHGKYHQRWHVTLIDPRGRCREVTVRTRLADAQFVAEGRVRKENQLRAA